MVYIPDGHQKYSILPSCRKFGGEVFSYSSPLENEIRKLLPDDEHAVPYGYESYEAFEKELDDLIGRYGLDDGQLNQVGQLLVEFKADIRRRNNKENWSIVRYVGETTSNVFGFTKGRYYYCPCSIENPEYEGIIDDEEFTSYLASIGDSEKGYYSLTEAVADGIVEFGQERCDWEIVVDPTGIAARWLNGHLSSAD